MNTPLKHVQWDPSVKTHATPQNQTREVSTGGWSLGRVYLHGNVEGKASEKNNNRPYILSSLCFIILAFSRNTSGAPSCHKLMLS